MQPVSRDEILDYMTYNDRRSELRTAALQERRPRRIQVGAHLCLLFENTTTVRYQIQEMMRVEQIVREAAIQHEIDTYNELIGAPGELRCTLLVAVEEADRPAKLTAWLNLNEHLYARTASGATVRPQWDPRQVGETRLSSVQYLTFAFGDDPPVAFGCDHEDPAVASDVALSEEQQAALRGDLLG